MREALHRAKLGAVYDRFARRYDFQHALATASADQRGREILVEKAVGVGDKVLDCGAGTGSTALLAARKVGSSGKVVLFERNDACPNNCSIIIDNKQPRTCRSNLRRVRMLNNRELPNAASRDQQYLTLPVRSDPAYHTRCNRGGSRFGASLRLVIAEMCSNALGTSTRSR